METAKHSKMSVQFYQTTGCTSLKTIIFSIKNSKKLCSTICWNMGYFLLFQFSVLLQMALSDCSSSSTSNVTKILWTENVTVQVSIHDARTKILKFQWYELLCKQQITLLKRRINHSSPGVYQHPIKHDRQPRSNSIFLLISNLVNIK